LQHSAALLLRTSETAEASWIPAFAGMTMLWITETSVPALLAWVPPFAGMTVSELRAPLAS
jgi:hypothetical protein